MSMGLESEFLASFLQDINHSRLILPSLPEIVLKIRQIAEDEQATAAQLAKAMSADPVLSARLVRVVNSPLYRGRESINNLQSAIARMGNKAVRSLVLSFATEQMFHGALDPRIAARLQTLWQHSTLVAAGSRVLAVRYTRLDPEQAMLAGLIHDIGVLPILSKAETQATLMAQPETLDNVIDKLHCIVGVAVLDDWGLPDELVNVVSDHDDIRANVQPDRLQYIDVVRVANVYSHHLANGRYRGLDWTTLPSYQKLRIPNDAVEPLKKAIADEWEALRSAFVG